MISAIYKRRATMKLWRVLHNSTYSQIRNQRKNCTYNDFNLRCNNTISRKTSICLRQYKVSSLRKLQKTKLNLEQIIFSKWAGPFYQLWTKKPRPISQETKDLTLIHIHLEGLQIYSISLKLQKANYQNRSLQRKDFGEIKTNQLPRVKLILCFMPQSTYTMNIFQRVSMIGSSNSRRLIWQGK